MDEKKSQDKQNAYICKVVAAKRDKYKKKRSKYSNEIEQVT